MAVILLSGGIDSTVALDWMLRERPKQPHLALNIMYPSKQNAPEAQAAYRVWAHYQDYNLGYDRVAVPNVYNLKGIAENALLGGEVPETITPGNNPAIVPGRNLLFISIAVAVALDCGHDSIVMGMNKDDWTDGLFPDCSPAFVGEMQRAIAVAYELTLWTPNLFKTKAEVVQAAKDRDVPLDLTWSCYNPTSWSGIEKWKQCGICPACVAKRDAFRKVGIYDSN